MNKEENNPSKCPICGRTTHKESKYCIFHASAEEKTEDEFRKALKEYVDKIKKEDDNYNFKKFIFVGDINFKKDLNIIISKNANFTGAIFEEDTWFMDIHFKGSTDFSWAIFKKDAIFLNATFEGDIHFNKVIFEKYADFVCAKFKGNTSFDSATFEDTDFDEATFEEDANFWWATFKEDVSFAEATFKGYVYFDGATFEGDVDFRVKSLLKDVTLTRIRLFSGKKLNLKVKNDIEKISLERAFLDNAYLDIELAEGILIDFSGALLRNTKIERGQIENHFLQEKEKDFSEAKDIYLLLKNNFHSTGRYEDENWAFKKEKDMERKNICHFKTLHKWLWSCFLNGIFGYGMQPSKVIMSGILIITLFAFLFMNLGISNVVGIEFNTSNNFLDCMYFSTITFTTLGYGDFRPLEGLGRVLAGSEAFIGAFMMALFVYTFARRTGGR